MTRIADGLRTAPRFFAHLLVVALLCALSQRSNAATAAAPRIANAQIGFSNQFKLGCWTPVTVDVGGVDAEAAKHLRVDVTAVDSDGVATIASASLSQSTGDNDVRTVTVYTQVGRSSSPIRISLLDGNADIDAISLAPNAAANSKLIATPIPATTDLIVVLSASPANLSDAFTNRGPSGSQTGRRLIELNKVAALPTEWYGYDAVNVLIIPVGDGQLCKDLAADKPRYAALNRWVQLGGRLVIMCGGQNAQGIIGADGPLASLVPGKFADTVPLRQTGPLEHYASAAAITGASIEVPRLTDVDGNIDAYAEGRATRLPLIVRAPRGFGEITFVGVEFNRPPLADWSGRTAFLHALLHPYLTDVLPTDSTQKLVTSGFNDLSGALRQRLGQNFARVVPIGFPIVAGLAVAYLMFLGPVDYLLVHRWLRRPLVAWVTLPIMICGFTAAAVAISNWSKGVPAPRLNRLELIDVDTIGKTVRGTLWAALYSPGAQQFDLSVKPPANAIEPANSAEILFSWWGLPGVGIGGMQSGGTDLGIVRESYRYAPAKNALEQVPVLTSGTKSLLARWNGDSPLQFDAQLNDQDGLVSGTIVNQTGLQFTNARLLYSSWAYRLGNLKTGQSIEIGEALSPRRAKTIVTREALGDSGPTGVQAENRVFSAEQASAPELLNTMMFYETAGGFSFAHVPNRYQAYCDLSRQLELGRAILVADASNADSQFSIGEASEQPGDESLSTSNVIYRFLLPVTRSDTP